jgi:hypothetical protein
VYIPLYTAIHHHRQPVRARPRPPPSLDNSKKHQARSGAHRFECLVAWLWHSRGRRPVVVAITGTARFLAARLRPGLAGPGLRICAIAVMPGLELTSVNGEMLRRQAVPAALSATKTDYCK